MPAIACRSYRRSYRRSYNHSYNHSYYRAIHKCTCTHAHVIYLHDRVRAYVCIDQTIPDSTTSPILIIKLEWMQSIFNDGKNLEIRNWSCKAFESFPCRIWLCGSGTSGLVFGWVDVEEVIGPLTEDEWRELRPLHQVPSTKRLFGERTLGWRLGARGEFPTPLQVVRSGARGIQYGTGL